MERQWINEIKKDPSFRLVKGKEYFNGSWEAAVNLLTRICIGTGHNFEF